MKGLWLGLMIGALSIGPARAQTAEPLDHWSTEAVLDALRILKASEVRSLVSASATVVTARTRDGLNAAIYAKACDPAPPGVEAICHGLEAIISFDPGPKADRRALAGRLNHQFAPGKFLAEPDGSIRLSRYLDFDGGVTPANLRAELSGLFTVGALTTQTLWPQTAKK